MCICHITLARSRAWHLRNNMPCMYGIIFMLWLVKIWQVRSYVKFSSISWKLFTLTAEADRVLSQLVIFLTVFFHWMYRYKMKYSCYKESSLIHGWFVYWVFGWEMRRLSKPIIRFRMASFLLFTMLDAYFLVASSSLKTANTGKPAA